jgi:tetratricopeptide (TPR) repeat protein
MILRFLLALFLVAAPCSEAAVVQAAAPLTIPDGAAQTLEEIYSGRNDEAIRTARQMQRQLPEHPLGYLLEAEALWWKIWCSSAEFKYGITAPRHRDRLKRDEAYLGLAAKAYSLAQASLAREDSAEMHLYAGMADALAARLYGIRQETRATARAGVRARENFKKTLTLDPAMADACMGLGLYDYYVDTLSTMARMLRFFMGIPGGSKSEGIELLHRAMREGQLTPVIARFYLAMNLHNYDRKYEEALETLNPLVEKYPQNAIFQMARGDLYAKLGRKKEARTAYEAAMESRAMDEECRKKIAALAEQSMEALGE